MLLVSLV